MYTVYVFNNRKKYETAHNKLLISISGSELNGAEGGVWHFLFKKILYCLTFMIKN